MSKEKRVSVRKFEEAAENNFDTAAVFTWFGLEVTVRKFLPLREMAEFVAEIVDSCFVEDVYHPEFMDLTIKTGILERYTNITLPTNTEKLYGLIYGTDIVENVMGYVHMQQMEEIIAAANRKIKFVCDSQVNEVQAKLNQLSDSFGLIAERLSKVFGGVNEEDIQKVARAIGEGGIDEAKIVAAFTDQMRKTSDK